MANKIQSISALASDVSKSLSDYTGWTNFLKSASWQYKYPFEDQLLIFSQRPDATACASIEMWNNKLHRWINKGSKGIALLRERGDKYYLDYVFDVADTNSFYGNEIKLWKYNDKYDNEIIETLESTFGEFEVTTTLTDAIICAAHNAVTDNKADYLQELKYAKKNSFLDGLDKLNIDIEFEKTAEVSVAYMIMARLGLEPDDTFDREEFEHIIDFNTPQTIGVLGNIVSSISETALREISETIRAVELEEKKQAKFFAENKNAEYNKDKEENQPILNTERTEDYGRDNIHESERLPDSESNSTGADRGNREIRSDEENIPQTKQTEPILHTDDDGQTVSAPIGDRQVGNRADTTDSIEDGAVRGHNGENESRESYEMDRADEQLSPFGGSDII